MNFNPQISIITPTKNRRELLIETINSVLKQDFKDWEHVIVDDGSDDGTQEVVSSFSSNDPRIRFFKREGKKSGANVCRNQGILAARGQLIIFLDSDDLLDVCALSLRSKRMERNLDCDFIVHQGSSFIKSPGDLNRQEDLDLLSDDLTRFLYFELPWIITAPTWRKSALLRLGLFDEQLLSWQDVELHIRALTSKCRYLKFPIIDHHIRWQYEETKVSVEQRRSPSHLSAAENIFKIFESHVRDGPGMTWVRQRALCSLYFFVSELWVDSGSLNQALKFWWKVFHRRLGPPSLYFVGGFVLIVRAILPSVGERLGHKWKGWARLRTNPELLVVDRLGVSS